MVQGGGGYRRTTYYSMTSMWYMPTMTAEFKVQKDDIISKISLYVAISCFLIAPNQTFTLSVIKILYICIRILYNHKILMINCMIISYATTVFEEKSAEVTCIIVSLPHPAYPELLQ